MKKQAADPQPAGFCTCLCLAATTGDIIFQISRSSQSKAIQLATHSDYSHTGMLVIRNKKPYVFEAVGPVKYTPLKQWIAHGEKGKYVVRRVEGGLSVEQQQKTGANGKTLSR
ncbi:putative peptidoglycan peptidase [Escherichia coli]|uniref:Putative peptidoglycan peptidase n=1 Tax=Escherichia coli TaxID=562 RepID=A0A377CD38_ECOLX|nr:putative peptidoglycan peptidase [Escherichia coli]